jgi:peptidoglycan-associated lipoprotein
LSGKKEAYLMNRGLLVAVVTTALAAGPGCATKTFVNGRLAEMNDKLDSLTSSVEQTQSRVQTNERAVSSLNEKTEAVDRRAGAAQASADAAARTAAGATTRAQALEHTVNRVVYELVLSEDQPGFAFGAADVPIAMKDRLDALVQQLRAKADGVYFEIEGHTDSTGPADFNRRLGLERAEAVKVYLYERHHVPLHRINVVSYGAGSPVATNLTSEGRAQNRRIVIRVLQ